MEETQRREVVRALMLFAAGALASGKSPLQAKKAAIETFNLFKEVLVPEVAEDIDDMLDDSENAS